MEEIKKIYSIQDVRFAKKELEKEFISKLQEFTNKFRVSICDIHLKTDTYESVIGDSLYDYVLDIEVKV